jgi:hypothetical protein
MAASDESPVVRREIASAVDRLPLDARWSIVAALVSHAVDADDHNLPLMYWYIMEPLAEADPDRALALGMAAGENFPMIREFMLRRVGGSGTAEAIDRLMAGLQRAESEDVQLIFLTAMRSALSGQRSVEKPAEWDAMYATLSSLPANPFR